MSSHITRGIWIVLALFLSAGWVHASVGTVQFSSGDVKIRDAAGKLRDARKGDLINEGDTILTGGQASAQLKMSDGGILAVRQETELKITQYTFSGKEDGTESAFMSLFKGGFRTITGIIGRANKDNYKVGTPTATIGIRGTDHEPHFVPPVPLGAPQPSTPPGTYDKVNVGVAFIATPQGSVNIAQNQVGFAAPNQAPQLLPVMPDIFKATPPINQARQEKEAEKEKQAAAEKEKQAAAPKPAAKPAAGTGGQSQESQGTPAAENAADTPAASQAAAPSEVRSTAIVDNTSSPGTGTTTTISTTTATTTASTPTITQTVSGTSSSSNLDVDLTTQTVAPSGGGAPAPISQGAYATQAQSGADEAQVDANLAAGAHTQTLTFESQTNTAVTSIGSVVPVSTVPATSAISTAGTDISSAQAAVTSAAALTPVDLTAATSAVNSATTNFNTQQTAFNNLGAAVDITATGALSGAGTAVANAVSAVGALPASPVSLTNANTAITNASGAIGTADTAVTNVNALVAPNAALATTNALSSTAVRTTAETRAAQAAAAIAANGVFADAVYAVPANTATQAAVLTVQNKDGLVQSAAGDAATQAAAFNMAKSTANTLLGSANTSLGLANSFLSTATTENTSFTNAKAAANTALNSANTNLGAATSALGNANSFNTTFNSDKTAAQNSLSTASGQIATAGTELTNAQNANAALAAAITAAQQALANANAAVAAANGQLTTANSNNTAILTAQAAVSGLSSQAAAAVVSAQNAANLAQVAASAAQVAATDALVKQNAGDFAGAQAALGTALARLGDAQVQLTAAQTAQGQAQTVTNTATSQLATAQSAVTAASNAVSAAVTAANSASGFAGTAVTQSSTAATQQTAATTAAGNASTAAGNAQSSVTSAQGSIGTASTAKSSAASSVSSATTAAGTAQSDAGTAQTQAGNASTAFTNASSAATSGETLANSVQTAASLVQNQAGSASTAQGAAVAAVATTTTELANAQTAANTVASNYQQAQYNNPAVVSSNFTHVVLSQRPLSASTTEGVNISTGNSTGNNLNTEYVLDGNRNLVEIRNTEYGRSGWNYPAQAPVTGANVKFSGGTPADTFNIVDANGAFYMGRWAGGQVGVTGPITTTDVLGLASSHWLIELLPANASSPYPTSVNSVQTIVGTSNYSLLAATQPTDSYGNVGVLNSATLSANFSAQTVDAGVDIAFASRDIRIQGSASNVPIEKEGFEAKKSGRFQPIVTCSDVSGGCATAAPNGYAGNIGGWFGGTPTGTVGTRVAMGYKFSPFLAGALPGTPYSDLIGGLAVLTTASTPTPGVLSNFNGSTDVRNEVRYLTQALATSDIYAVNIRDTVSGLTTNTGFTYNGPRTSNNVMFDAAGNLVRIFDTGYVIFDHSPDVAATTTGFRVPTPLANAQVSFGANGSVAAEHYEYTPTGYTDPIIRLGRWQGGAINVLDTATGDAYLDPIMGSAHWLVRQGQGVPSFPVTGTHHYSRVAATAPTDNYGNAGTLEGARLAVDFNRMLVSLGMRISMPGFGGSLLSARASEAPIVSGGFNVSSSDYLKLSCIGVGCAPNQTYGGRVRGAFAGENAAGTAGVIEGAYYRYTFNTNYPDTATAAANGRVNDEYVDGYAAFGRDPAAGVGSTIVTPASNPALFSVNGSTNPPGDAVILNAYAFTNNSNPSFPFTEMRTNSFDAAGSSSRWGAFPPGYAIDGSGNLTFASHFFEGDNERITITGGTSPVNFSAQGITHGYVLQPTLSGVDWNGPFVSRVPLDAFHWLRGPALFPWYAGAVMTNAVNGSSVGYAQLGGLVTNQAGVAGSSVTGTLQVNFNAQSVNTSINAIVSGGTFTATANGVALDDGGFFWVSSGGGYRHAFNTLTFNSVSGTVPAFGNLNGLLMNTTPAAAPNDGILGGAGIAFAFNSGSSADRATGTLVFGNPAYVTPLPPDGSVFQPSALMDYRVLLVASGMGLGDAANSVPPPGSVTRDGTGSTPLVSEWDNYQVRFNAVTSDRTQTVNSNTVTTPNPLGLVNPQGALIKFDGSETMIRNFCASGPQCNSETQLPTRYALANATGGGPTAANRPLPLSPPPTAVALEVGYDAASGVRWGRWGGGFLNVGDRGSPNGAAAPPPGTAPATVDLRVQNWHYLITGSQAGPVTIPTTGTANYTLIGGTSPTAFTPGQSLPDVGTLGSVTLAVNFGTQLVTSLSVNASTPLSGNWSASAVNLPIIQKSVFFAEKSLSGGGNGLVVTRNGDPTGSAGQIVGGFTNGATAAGLAYSLNQNGPVGTTISGVAVLRR